MITESKVTEIFCISDGFCKEFEVEMAKNALPSSSEYATKRRRKRMMSRCGGHNDPDLLPLQHLPQLQALLSVLCMRTVETSVPAPVLVQPFCRGNAALLRGTDNVPASCLLRRMHRHKFC